MKFSDVSLGFVMVTAFSLLSVNALQASEINIDFIVKNQKVIGTLHTIEGNPKAPVVLLFHGFSGSRNELAVATTNEGVFSRTARLLGEKGYASLRIDFRGSGESEGKWEDTTFSGQIEDGIAAVDWLRTSKDVDGSKLSILGWSQGGLVAAHVAKARPDIKSLTLWAPVVAPLYTYPALLGADNMAKAFASPADTPLKSTLPWGTETTLKAAFYQEMALYSPVAAIAAFKGPMQVIVGSKDTTVTPQPASGQILLDYHDGAEELDVFDTDHVWSAFTGPDVIDTKMVPTTVKWLETYNPSK